jgi:hypothetical protein
MDANVFAKRVFTVAGIYGLIVLLPLYFMEHRLSQDQPPAISHPEFYYGFVGIAVAWQVAFLIIGRDPERYRLLMLAAILEKVAYGFAAVLLFLDDRLAGSLLAGGIIDLILAVLFAMAFRRTPFGLAGTRSART